MTLEWSTFLLLEALDKKPLSWGSDAGLELDEAKEQTLAPERCYLGQSVDFGRASALDVVKFDLKPYYRENMDTSIAEVLASGRCSSGTDAKIRGQAGWASTTIHGKCGRIGQWALVQRQYFDDLEAIIPALEQSCVTSNFCAK